MAGKNLGVFLVLLLIFAAQKSMVQKVEARVCDVLSDKFKGPCFSSSGCDDVCTKKEHLISGLCKGNFNCYCRKNC